MKKTIFSIMFAIVAMCVASCGTGSTGACTDVDSTAVDTLVDTVAVDSVVVDTLA